MRVLLALLLALGLAVGGPADAASTFGGLPAATQPLGNVPTYVPMDQGTDCTAGTPAHCSTVQSDALRLGQPIQTTCSSVVTPFLYQECIDTSVTPRQLKIWLGSQWVEIFSYDTSAQTVAFPNVPISINNGNVSINSNSFCGTVVAMGGNVQSSFTVAAASGFNAGCRIIISNIDSQPATYPTAGGHAKIASGITLPTGYLGNNLLYPRSSVTITQINNAWVVSSANLRYKPLPAQPLTVYVDPLNGSDNNDGFSVSTAMKNPTTCYYRALADFDFNSNDPAETCDIINDSVDNTSGCMHLSADGFVGAQGGAQFIFDGFDPVNAVNRKLTCTGNAPFQVFLYTDINMRRITLSSDAACITAGYKSIVNILDGVIFNGCGTTGAIVISEDALVFITNDITINSPYAYFINSAGGRITTGVVTIHGGSNAGTTFVGSSTNGTVDLRAVSFSGFAFTGQHCSAASGGRVLTVTGNADTDLPGTTISTTSNGGWCGNQSLGAGVTSFLKQATYDLTTASGTQALTGFGFKPSACHFKGTVIGSAVGSYTTYGGDVDSAGNQSAVYAGGGATNTYDNSSVMVAVNAAATATQVAKVQSFDTDGLTLSWTKVSTPTVGTFNFSAMCLK